ncbi:MAG: beta-propeller domain-containing protein [Thermoproteota archaeon]
MLRDNGESREETSIYRIELDNGEISAQAQGAVSGYVLNQFSMDEYDGYFRIATTKWSEKASKNNIFILNMSLDVVGILEGLAPGERIYSVRFMGERCYLVTFRQIDPFYVIDVSQPTAPEVLGYLKIPGFSGYLHLYDNNHIIGVGMEENQAKLSLFDVTDVTKPQEMDKYTLPDGWAHTPVLNDHKAFLFEKSKNLVALPISISIKHIKVKEEYDRGSFWQGAYVFDLSLDRGFVLKGNINHQDSENQFEAGSEVKKNTLHRRNHLYNIPQQTKNEPPRRLGIQKKRSKLHRNVKPTQQLSPFTKAHEAYGGDVFCISFFLFELASYIFEWREKIEMFLNEVDSFSRV